MYRHLGTGGAGGPVPPLEFGFYRVKIFKMDKISFSLLFGPPLGKNRSQGPGNMRLKGELNAKNLNLKLQNHASNNY